MGIESMAKNAFEALADPTRRAILKRLRKGSRTAGELAEGFELTKPTLSHHFKVLREAGLVRAESRGTSVCTRSRPTCSKTSPPSCSS